MHDRAGLRKTSAAAVNVGGGERAGRSSSPTSSGANLTAAVLPKASDPAGAKCQAAIQKGSGKFTATLLKSFLACKKNGLKSTIPLQQIDSAAKLSACFDALLADAERQDRQGGDEIRSRGRQELHAAGRRATDGLSGAVHVGTNPFMPSASRRACAVIPCLMLDAWDGLDRLCDAFDDGLPNNASCGAPLPFEETLTVPNTVEPDETPGSPGVVVTNPKLITQFGGTGFSLNNSKYTRWRLNGPVQTPDAILVVVAGFGAGANNFRS